MPLCCLHVGLSNILFLARSWCAVEECLHRCFAIAPSPLVGSHLIVGFKPCIKISLQGLNTVIDFLAEGDAVKFLQYGLVEALADTIGLG